MIEIKIKIHALRNKEELLQLPYFADKSIYEYIEDILQIIVTTKIPNLGRLLRQNTIRVLVNNRVIHNDLLKTKKLKDSDQLKLLIIPAYETLAIALFGVAAWEAGLTFTQVLLAGGLALFVTTTIGGAIGLLQYQLMPKPTKPRDPTRMSEESPNYTWEGPTTSYAVGKPVSLIYGNPWVGGDIISAYIEGLQSVYGNTWWSISEWEGHPGSYLTMGEMHSSRPTLGVPHENAAVLIDLSSGEVIKANEIEFKFNGYNAPYKGRSMCLSTNIYIHALTVDDTGAECPPYGGATAWSLIYSPTIGDPQVWHSSYTESITRSFILGGNVFYKFFIYYKYYWADLFSGDYEYSRPLIASIRVRGQGPIDKIDTLKESLVYQEGLRVVLALSDGEIANIDDEFYLNDIAKSKFYIEAPQGNQVNLLEVQKSMGHKVPILDSGSASYVTDLVSKKLLSCTAQEFLLKQSIVGFPSPPEPPTPVAPEIFDYQTVSDTVEGFTIELVFPSGLYKRDEDGDESNGLVQLEIRYFAKVGTEWESTPKWITGISTAEKSGNYLNITKFKMGEIKTYISAGLGGDALPSSQYLIQVRRLSPVATDAQKGWDELKIIGVSEFGYERHLYPSTTYVAMNIIATDKLSGSLPNFVFNVSGRFVKCPVLTNTSGNIIPIQFPSLITEYNPGTLQYDWKYKFDGITYETLTLTENTQYQYTSCPPFIIYDLLTSQDLYPYISEDTFVWQDWVDAAEICWEGILPTQYAPSSTGTEHRFELDIVIDTEQDAALILVQLLSLIRGKLYWIGNKLRLKIMKPENPTQLFTDADILPDTYQEVYNQESKLPNTIEVSYYDRKDRGKQQTLQISKKDASYWKGRIIKQSVSLIGVSRQSEALRTASYLLNYASISNKVITFTVPISALVSVPGDVIEVQHSTMTYGNGGYFREISNVDTGITTFYLDRTVYLDETLSYVMIVSRRTTNTAGIPTEYELIDVGIGETDYYDTVRVNSSITPDYAIGDIWYIVQQGVTPTQYVKKYRILLMDRASDKDEVVVTCEPYDENIYGDYVTGLDTYLPPTKPIDIINAPVDVINLTASQLWGTYDVKVTYAIPSTNDYSFSSKVETITDNIFIYRNTDNDTQLTSTRSLFIYDGTTGESKGQVYIEEVDRTDNEITFIEFDSFRGPIIVGDYVIQKIEGSYLQVDHTIVAISTDGRVYNEVGTDSSKGSGYLIKALQVNKTYWIKVQSVAITGTKSLNPPITTIKIGTTECIDSPTHLTLCNQGEDVSDFINCDICISWNKSSAYAGAGMAIEGDADDSGAGESGDYKLSGYNVWIYDNSGDTPQFLRMEQVKDPTYTYTQDTNKDDQWNLKGSRSGQRYISFQIYQEDLDGNVSCEPAALDVQNNPPSMNGFTPTHTVSDRMVTINWGEYIHDPALFEVDILGYQVWYGTSDADMASIDIPDKTIEQTKLTGLSSGTYYIYVIPYDCFGTGTVATYRSNILTAVIVGEVISEYIPPLPGGFAGSFVIEEVTDSGTYYTMYLTGASLNLYGFSNITDPEDYISLPYHSDKVYYNTNPAVDGYCYVTSSIINTSTVNDPQLRIWYDETIPLNPRWAIRISPAPPAILVDYGYLVADGVPQVGQYVSINICGGLTYEEGGVFWGGSLKSEISVRWFSPNENTCNMDRVSYFEFTISSPTSAIVSQPHIYVDGSVTGYHYADGDYYEQTFNGPGETSVSVACKLWSDSDNISETISSGIFISTDSLSNSDNLDIINAPWRVVTDDGGRNIQVVLDNWDILWNNPNIKQLEVYAQLGTWNFLAVPPVFEQPIAISNIDQYPDRIANYQEYEYTYGGHTRLVNTDPVDDSIHFRLGETTGPIFAWKNEQCSSEGGLCIYRTGSPPEYSCALSCSGYGTGDCPHGSSFSCDQGGSCTYISEDTGCSRVVEEVIYNKYYIALGFRLVNGNIVFVRNADSGDIEVKGTEFGLIDSMFIMNAAITTAKINDLAVNNAKIRNLAAEKVWIGGSGEPFSGACIHDNGIECSYHGWKETQTPTTVPPGYYKTGLCPLGLASGSGLIPACHFTEGLFAVSRLFELSGGVDDQEFTYINGGFIYTNSIMARSIQVGALSYVLDLQVDREYDFSITDALLTSYVTVRWHKSGQDLVNGMISFVDDTKIYIIDGVHTFTGTEIPSGIGTDTRRIHVGYIDYFDTDVETTPQAVQFTQVDDVSEGGGGLWEDPNNTFAHLRTEGRLPLFAVVIVNSPLDEAKSLDGGATGDPQTIVNSDFGQFLVRITMANPSPGTYIRNDDITTGIVHNEAWTSVLDLRHYTGYDVSIGHVGHGRLLLDAPSQVYSHDLGNNATFGWHDGCGREWWTYLSLWPNAYGCDVKLLIGRPYVDGLESQPGFNGDLSDTMALCDDAYLWFYRAYDDVAEKWYGNLEIGGKLRVKDTVTLPYRDLLVGQHYEASGLTWIRVNSSGITYYDITNFLTEPYDDNVPELLMKLGGNKEIEPIADITTTHYFMRDNNAGNDIGVCINGADSSVLPISPYELISGDMSLLILSPVGGEHMIFGDYYTNDVGLYIKSSNLSGEDSIYIGTIVDVDAKYALVVRNIPTKAFPAGSYPRTYISIFSYMTDVYIIGSGVGTEEIEMINLYVESQIAENLGVNQGITSIGIYNDPGNNAPYPAYYCHMRTSFRSLIDTTPEAAFGSWSVGEIGDIIFGEHYIWYKTNLSGEDGWRRVCLYENYCDTT